jgi:hypothetical protein
MRKTPNQLSTFLLIKLYSESTQIAIQKQNQCSPDLTFLWLRLVG